jgi:hypothetical protein
MSGSTKLRGFGSIMPVIDRAEKPERKQREPWSRQNKIGVIALIATVVFGTAGVVGWKLMQSDSGQSQQSMNNYFQFNGQNQIPSDRSEAQSSPDRGCSDDPNDASLKGAWGPGRNLLAQDQLSEFPSFNLDKLPGGIGDERYFYSVRDTAALEPYLWTEDIRVERGKTYLLRIYVHNSAADSDEDVAKDTRVMVNLPVCTGRKIASTAWITSSNSWPREIWDGVTFSADEFFNLVYVPGSARLCNNYFTCDPAKGGQGAPISNDFLTNKGALTGYDSLDGSVRGGYRYSSYLGFEVRPQFSGP